MSFLPVAEPWWAKYAAQLIIGLFSVQFLTNVRSVIEHWFSRKETRDVKRTVEAIHVKLNGGLDALIQEKVDKAMEERR